MIHNKEGFFGGVFKTIYILLLVVAYGANISYAQFDNYEKWKKSVFESSWETASYDLNDKVGYEQIGYKRIPRGEYSSWDIDLDMDTESLRQRPEFTVDQPYVARTGGVNRGEWYSPDEIGKIYRENGVYYGGTGNSTVESVWIRKKYGLPPVESVPGGEDDINFTGFSEDDYRKYRDSLRAIMQRHEKELVKKEETYDRQIIDNPRTIWVLGAAHTFKFFLNNLQENYESINKTFKEEKGFHIPKEVNPSTPKEKARRSIFVHWVRTKMQGILALQSEIFHDHIDPEGTVISNIHGEDVVDFEVHGSMVDHPGPSGRAQFSDREMVLRYWDGYIFRMWRDLTDKILFSSARINNGVVRARSIPTREAVKYWHNQGVQNGTVGFYQWLNDYGPRNGQGGNVGRFSGPAFANPDSSTLPKERWNAVLDISRELSHTKVFDPPTSKTGILLSFDTVNIHGWKRMFSTYVELAKSGVWNSFISDREIMNGSEDLDQWEVIYIPVMDYTHTEVIDKLRSFIQEGGTVISLDPNVFSYDMSGNDISGYRKELFGISGKKEKPEHGSVQMNDRYSSEFIYSPETSYSVTPSEESESIGVYPDGSTAVVSHGLGEGQAIYWGMPLANVYLTSPYHDPQLDGRGDFYKNIERQNGITDYSWIWNITVDNLDQVTGTRTPTLPPVKSDTPLD